MSNPYFKLIESRVFRFRKEAEAWANEEKATYTKQGVGVKKEVDFIQGQQQWRAKIYVKV